MTYKLTRRHFATFTRAFGRYLALYGLSGWHIEFHHEADSSGSMASVAVTFEAHRADVYLAPVWDEEPSRERLYAKARHEVFHVFVAKLADVATRRYLSETDVTEAEEELVVRLMNITKDL